MRGIYSEGQTITASRSVFPNIKEGESYLIKQLFPGRVVLQNSDGDLSGDYPITLILCFPLPDRKEFEFEEVICPICWGGGDGVVHVWTGRAVTSGWERRPCSVCLGAKHLSSKDAFAWIDQELADREARRSARDAQLSARKREKGS